MVVNEEKSVKSTQSMLEHAKIRAVYAHMDEETTGKDKAVLVIGINFRQES